jgi:protein-L-isoaspartate(D-aspartate) O-methyltransferase
MPSATQDTSKDAFLNDARNRMVDSQVRPNRVSDPRILDTMRTLKRERFVPAALHPIAYADQNVPLGGGRVLLQPMVLARLLQAAMPLPNETVLVVGAGTGYSAAVLAAMGCRVTALEESATLLDQAKPALSALAPSITLVSGPLASGWPQAAPYDFILIDGAVQQIPPVIGTQLNRDGGRLVTIIRESDHSGHAVEAEPTPVGLSVRTLFDCRSPVLPGFAAAPVFQF